MSEDNKELNKAENNDGSFKTGDTYTVAEMEKMFPGFKKQVEKAANEENNEDDGITIGGRHYTKKQLEWMADHPMGQMKKWTKDQKKARNKKNKAAAASRKKNRKK